MSDYSEFFLNSKRTVIQYDTLEISHPSFDETYYLVRNKTDGLEARTDDGDNLRTFEYVPMRIEDQESRETLDYGIKITLGDLGEIIPHEIDNVEEDEAFDEKPKVIYRTYRSDKLGKPILGPIELEVETFTFNEEGCTFEAKAPDANINGTGEIYTLDRFPMLRGFL